MAQMLRVFVALLEDQDMIPITPMESSATPIPGDLPPFLASVGTEHACGTQTYTQAKDPYS